MKSKWFAFGCLSSVIIVLVMFIISVTTIGKIGKSFQKAKVASIPRNSYLQINISGPISDYQRFEDDFLTKNATSLHELMEKINTAAHDEKIKGIVLTPQFIQCGYANLHELENSLRKFQEQGKKIYAYLKIGYDKDYFLCSLADEIYLNPSASGGLLFTGIGGSSLFYKKMLDKIGVNVEVIHAGKYKGAGENFSRSSFSAPVKQNLEKVFDELYGKIIATISQNRDLSVPEVMAIYEERDEVFISGKKALEYKLVDELLMFEDIYQKLNIDEDHLIELSKYNIGKRKSEDNQIAILYADGGIAQQNELYSANYISASFMDDQIDKIAENDKIKAVVLRINSPGGSALESEIIHDRIAKLKAMKPVVISMGNVAASGGYYISANADHIVADPFTITGSIGVVAMLPNAKELADKLGLTTDEISRGKYADLLNPLQKADKREYDALRKNIQLTYLEFKERVAAGRNIDLDSVEKIAQGQIWSADLAQENGLIDQIGLMNDAVSKAAELAKISDYSVEFYPKKKSFIENLLSEKLNFDLTAKMKQQIIAEMELEKALFLLKSIKNDPMQAVMEIEIK